MALTWLLATYGAIGFFFSAQSIQFPINDFIVVSIICLFGMIGNTSIWYLDICIYQKFWGAFFVEEVKMEKKYKYLIKIRNISLSLDNIGTRLKGHGRFYICANLLLIFTAGIFLVLLSYTFVSSIWIIAGVVLVGISVFKIMKKIERRLQGSLEKLLPKR